MKLPRAYYRSNQVVVLARDLLGKLLFTNIDGRLSGGMITETEAYAGITDRASHAYGNRRTRRTEVMFKSGGISYIYLCYGMHYLFNVVTGEAGVPHAILIRGLFPLAGVESMLKRTGKSKSGYSLSNGPGKLTKALGLNLTHNACSLSGDSVWIEDNPSPIDENDITVSARIGVDYAGTDAALPYRFVLHYEKYL